MGGGGRKRQAPQSPGRGTCVSLELGVGVVRAGVAGYHRREGCHIHSGQEGPRVQCVWPLSHTHWC